MYRQRKQKVHLRKTDGTGAGFYFSRCGRRTQDKDIETVPENMYHKIRKKFRCKRCNWYYMKQSKKY